MTMRHWQDAPADQTAMRKAAAAAALVERDTLRKETQAVRDKAAQLRAKAEMVAKARAAAAAAAAGSSPAAASSAGADGPRARAMTLMYPGQTRTELLDMMLADTEFIAAQDVRRVPWISPRRGLT